MSLNSQSLSLLSWTCLVSTGQKTWQYLAFTFNYGTVSYYQLFWLHSFPLTSFTPNKTCGTKHFLTQPYPESKSFFSALSKAKQMLKASFHKLYFPISWPSILSLPLIYQASPCKPFRFLVLITLSARQFQFISLMAIELLLNSCLKVLLIHIHLIFSFNFNCSSPYLLFTPKFYF